VQPSPTDPPYRNPTRWRMLALVTAVYTCFGITVSTIAPVVGPIIDDLHMTNWQMGLVLGVWQLVFIGTAPPLGALVDRIGERLAIAVGLAVILASLALRGLAVNFPTLLLAVAIFGVGGPIISVGVPKVVALWFDRRERGPAAGTYVIGRDVGVAVVLATAASFVVGLTGSWRGMSLVYGVFVFVVLVAWLAFAKNAPPGAQAQRAEPQSAEECEASDDAGGSLALLRLRNVQLVLLLGFATFFLNHGLVNWLPSLLEESGRSLESAGRWVALGLGVSMIGHILVPTIARHGYRAWALGIMLAVGSATSVGLLFTTGAAQVAMLLVGTLARMPTMQVLTLVLMETKGIGARRIGAAAGLFFAASEIGGFSGPLIMGVLRDLTGDLFLGVIVLSVTTAVLTLFTPLLKER